MKAKKHLNLRIPLWWPSGPNWRRLARWLLPSPGNTLFTLLVVGGLLWATSAGALPFRAPTLASDSTTTISYQGRLADSGGNPVTTSGMGMQFRLYNTDTGGSPLWEESHTAVPVEDGLFHVLLGSTNPIPVSLLANNSTLWLGIKVGSDSEMTPREQIASVPYSMIASSVANGAITTEKIADEAVTQAKLGSDVNLVQNTGGEGGAPIPSVSLPGWTADGGTNLPSGTWVNTQYITVPTRGVYLIISNYRIYGTNVAAFVTARLRWTDSASRVTEPRMIVESIQSVADFINYGGSVAWVINVDQDNKTIYADYLRLFGTADNEFCWQNDHNGVPRLIAVKLY